MQLLCILTSNANTKGYNPKFFKPSDILYAMARAERGLKYTEPLYGIKKQTRKQFLMTDKCFTYQIKHLFQIHHIAIFCNFFFKKTKKKKRLSPIFEKIRELTKH